MVANKLVSYFLITKIKLTYDYKTELTQLTKKAGIATNNTDFEIFVPQPKKNEGPVLINIIA